MTKPADGNEEPLTGIAKLRDDKFAYGLEVVLDGLALRLPG